MRITARLLAAVLGAGAIAVLSVPAGAQAATTYTTSAKVKQQPNEYSCGPTATWIALSARISPPAISTIGAYEGTDSNGTDDISLVRNALNHYLHTSFYEVKRVSGTPTAAQISLLKADMVYDFPRNYPIVGNVLSGWHPSFYPSNYSGGHYVALVGYNASTGRVTIMDPAGRPGGDGHAGGYNDWSHVPQKYTLTVNQIATWIGGKGYAA